MPPIRNTVVVRATTLALAALAASFVPPQSTWHVDANGAPPGDGSPGNPYTSIQHAIDQASTVDGDLILVAPGTYVETIDYGAKGVHVKSVAGPTETFVRAPQSTTPLVVYVYGSEGAPLAVFEGFDVSRDAPFASGTVGVRVSGNTDDIGYTAGRIRRCTIREHQTGIQCGYVGYVDECTVTDCFIGVSEFAFGFIVMRNSIAKGNGIDVYVPAIGSYPASLNHSNFNGSGVGLGGGSNNIDEDPRWWDAASGDLRLRPDSPCIDAGFPGDPPDPDGSTVDMGALTYDPFYAPGTDTYCFGSAAQCPCGNGGSGLGGCDVEQGTGGVAIGIRDFTPDDLGGGTATVVGTHYPVMGNAGVTLIRSPNVQDPPVVFGDGLRCIGATGLVRLGARLAVGGAVAVPVMHGAGAGTFRYQLWNRNTPVMFCDPTAAFNLSNALEVTWP